jgi:anionic cell wall polymer biosynthesis LytR-Cps2A-Psr (LCP) family protein
MSGTDRPSGGVPGPDLPPPNTPPVDIPPPVGDPVPVELLDPPLAESEPVPAPEHVAEEPPQRPSTAPDSGRAARRQAAEVAAQQQAATSRHRLLIVSGVVAGVVAAVFLVWAVFGRPSDNFTADPSTSAAPTGPVQPTLLFLVQDKEGIAVNDALMSVGGSVKHANVLTIPPNVVVDVATGGTLPFGQIARLPDANGPAAALSDAIGVNVNGTLGMNTLAFSGLVDAVGGVTADVDVDVIETKPDGSQVVLVPAGKAVVLQGPQAAAYSTYLAPGEPEEARMARFTQVLRLTVAKLPSDVTKVESILSGLGASARATVPTAEVASFLVRMQNDVLVDNAAYKNLPVRTLDTSGAVAYVVDQVPTAAMVQELLPDAVRTPGENSKVRVLVQNGVGTPGLNAAARQRIVDKGFTFVNGANAASMGHETTQIVVPDSSEQSRTWGNDIAIALGVSPSDVVIDNSGQTVADVLVILGADFKPTAS